MQFFSRIGPKIGAPSNRAEKLTTVIVLLIALNSLLIWYELKIPEMSNMPFYVGAIGSGMAILSLLNKAVLDTIVLIWFGFAWILSSISSRLILIGVYFLILFPLGVLSRLFKRDELHLKKPNNSNFVDCPHTHSSKDLVHPW